MTELSLKWKQIFDEISTADEHIVGYIKLLDSGQEEEYNKEDKPKKSFEGFKF
jgi:hypothetical protein